MSAAPEWARGWGRDLRVAAILLTRLPLPHEGVITPAEQTAALRAAPLVGLGIGLLAALAFALAAALGLSPFLRALAALAASVLATGALHEDGAADFADGLGGREREARLAIMRDSRIGSYGVLALLFSLGARAGALAALAESGAAAAALIAGAVTSRGLLAGVAFMLEPARRDGLGAEVAHPKRETALAALLLAALGAVLSLGLLSGLAALAAALAAACGIAALARLRLGGYTGDVLGAVQQAAEAAILLVAAAAL